MTAFVLLSAYAGIALFLIGCCRRIFQYATTPVHVRWELYPIPHEAAARARHGGSYFEESEWWSKPRRRNLLGELNFMLPEMLFLRGLWEFNRKLWYRSFPFHAGLYLLILASAAAFATSAGVAVQWFTALSRFAAWTGLLSLFSGATALLWRRMTAPELRNYTTAGDLFNVGMFALAGLLLLVARLTAEIPSPARFASALLTFDTSLRIPTVGALGLIISAFLAGYVPFTHMGHFLAKFFTYHFVRWDDAPLRGDRRLAAHIAGQLAYRPTWSAAHIGADGARTWADIASENPAANEVRR